MELLEEAAGVEDTGGEDCIQEMEQEVLQEMKEVALKEVQMTRCPCYPAQMQNLPFLLWLVSCILIFGSGTKSSPESVSGPARWPTLLSQAELNIVFAEILFLVVEFVHLSKLFVGF